MKRFAAIIAVLTVFAAPAAFADEMDDIVSARAKGIQSMAQQSAQKIQQLTAALEKEKTQYIALQGGLIALKDLGALTPEERKVIADSPPEAPAAARGPVSTPARKAAK